MKVYVYVVLKYVPYEAVNEPIMGVYGDIIDAECHRDTLKANERGDAIYVIQKYRVAEWEGLG